MKKKERCIVKARHDYKNESYPHTGNILDFLRCSVILDNPKHLTKVINQFIKIVENEDGKDYQALLAQVSEAENKENKENKENRDDDDDNDDNDEDEDEEEEQSSSSEGAWGEAVQILESVYGMEDDDDGYGYGYDDDYDDYGGYGGGGSKKDKKDKDKSGIIKIVRIKNGFRHFDSSKMKLQDYNYGDIKINVICKHNDVSMVCEIQLLLRFMLEAKKIGHAYYSFERKDEYYESLKEKIEHLKWSNIESLLKTQILSQNKYGFAKVIYSLNKSEFETLLKQENQNVIETFITENNWHVGSKLFKSMVN